MLPDIVSGKLLHRERIWLPVGKPQITGWVTVIIDYEVITVEIGDVTIVKPASSVHI